MKHAEISIQSSGRRPGVSGPAGSAGDCGFLGGAGRYLVQVAGCNDCHTEAYMPRHGEVPQEEWLMGSGFGWSGPWGTTYATNLRLWMQDFSPAQWLQRARTMQTRPPMPWFGLREMTDEDLLGIYHYIRHLGAAGGPVPAYLPPGQTPAGPYARFPGPPPS